MQGRLTIQGLHPTEPPRSAVPFRARIGSAYRMTNNFRVFNVSRGFTLKYKQALRAVEECACAWVVENKTIRDLTLAESIAARNHQAKTRTPLASSEIPGLKYDPPTKDNNPHFRRERTELLIAAREFAMQATL
jgi:hypothetical protein